MDIIEKITLELNSMSATKKRIAKEILQNPMQVAFSSAKMLADKLGISPASIVRFAQQITGGRGYPQLQQEIQAHVRAITDPIKKLEQNVILSTPYEQLLAQIYETQLINIKKTFNQELIKAVNDVTTMVSTAERIYTCGSRGAYATAYYLGHMLNRVFSNADTLTDDAKLVDYLVRVTKKDIVIFVCFPRYSARLLSAAKTLKKVGVKIITIDSSAKTPFAQYSDVLLTTFNHSNDFHNSQVSAMLVSEMIVSHVISNNLERSLDNLSRMEPAFSNLCQFIDEE